jgi:hypothetical protein
MSLKVCNHPSCGARWNGADECPACLGAGRGEVRDYHWAHEEDGGPTVPDSIVGDATAPGAEDEEVVIPEDEAGEPTEAERTGVEVDPADLDGDGIPDDEEDAFHQREADDSEVNEEDLSEHSRNRLSALARERGLDPSGTKAELLARLQGEGHG